MFYFKFSFTIFLLMFFPLCSKVFTNILKIYELPKINNTIPKYCQTLLLTIIIYQANSMSQLHLASELYPFIENGPLGAKNSFGTKSKEILGTIFVWKISCQKNPSFLLHQMLSLFSTINLVYVPEINIFGRDEIIQIWIISFKDIIIQC